jgi:hypothetical protein
MEIEVEQHEDQQHRNWDSHRKSTAGAFQLLELTAPFESVALGDLDLAGDGAPRLGNKARQIPAADVDLDADPALYILAADLRRAFLFPDLG